MRFVILMISIFLLYSYWQQYRGEDAEISGRDLQEKSPLVKKEAVTHSKRAHAHLDTESKSQALIPRPLEYNESEIDLRLKRIDQILAGIETEAHNLSDQSKSRLEEILLRFHIPENAPSTLKKILAADLIEIYNSTRHFHPKFAEALHKKIEGSRNAKILRFARIRYDRLIRDAFSKSE